MKYRLQVYFSKLGGGSVRMDGFHDYEEAKYYAKALVEVYGVVVNIFSVEEQHVERIKHDHV